MNICMIGYGMMGTWHSEALQNQDCNLHTLVGRRAEPAAAFASKYAYDHWTTDLDEALSNPAIDAVIVANPSEMHEETALRCLQHDKATLVEIPIAMNLQGSEKVVAEAEQRGLPLGVVHPMRFRPEREALRQRIAAGEEHIRHFAGRFFIHRLKNVGATGYQRSWVDNLLWHHTTHLLDLGLWMLEVEGSPIRNIYSHMPAVEPLTGIPMEVIICIETEADQTSRCRQGTAADAATGGRSNPVGGRFGAAFILAGGQGIPRRSDCDAVGESGRGQRPSTRSFAGSSDGSGRPGKGSDDAAGVTLLSRHQAWA